MYRSLPYKSSTKSSKQSYHRKRYIRISIKWSLRLSTFSTKKQKPKIIQYRSYKTFNNQVFQRELNGELLKIDLINADLAECTEIFLSILGKNAKKNKSLHEQITLIL